MLTILVWVRSSKKFRVKEPAAGPARLGMVSVLG